MSENVVLFQPRIPMPPPKPRSLHSAAWLLKWCSEVIMALDHDDRLHPWQREIIARAGERLHCEHDQLLDVLLQCKSALSPENSKEIPT